MLSSLVILLIVALVIMISSLLNFSAYIGKGKNLTSRPEKLLMSLIPSKVALGSAFSVGLAGIFGCYVFFLSPDPTAETAVAEAEEEEATEQESQAVLTASVSSPVVREFKEMEVLDDEASLQAGQSIFTNYCAACHGQNGEGMVGPNFTDPYWIHGGDLGSIYQVIDHGVPEKGMQPWGNQLSDEEMRQVGSYILSLKGKEVENPKAPQGKLFLAQAEEWAFVTNEGSEELSFLNAATNEVVNTITVGSRPRGVRVSPDGTRVYVAVSGSPRCPPWVDEEECEKKKADKSKDGIIEVDIKEQKVLRKLPSGSDPEQFDITPDGKRLVISNEDADKATIVDIKSGKIVKEVEVGREPEGVKISPDGKLAYVTGETDHNVTVVNTEDGNQVADIKVGERPRDVIFNNEGSLAFVSGEVDRTISVVDVKANEVIKTLQLEEGTLPMGMALSYDEQFLYVAGGRGGNLIEINLANGKVEREVKVGERPWGVSISFDGRRLYTANGPSHTMSVVDVRTFELVDSIAVGKMPWGVAVGPNPGILTASVTDAAPEEELDIDALVAGGNVQKGGMMFNAIYGCAHCHGTNAHGHTDNRNLRGLVERYGNNAEKVFLKVMEEGRLGTAMPPWDHLPEKKINDIKAFIFSLQKED